MYETNILILCRTAANFTLVLKDHIHLNMTLKLIQLPKDLKDNKNMFSKRKKKKKRIHLKQVWLVQAVHRCLCVLMDIYEWYMLQREFDIYYFPHTDVLQINNNTRLNIKMQRQPFKSKHGLLKMTQINCKKVQIY